MTKAALSDITVVELAGGVAGPYCARLLAAHGARIIKIEPPETGDWARRLLPRVAGVKEGDHSGLFAWLNANKESIALDADSRQDADIIRQICRHAQVVIDDRLDDQRRAAGLDALSLQKVNPGLMLCNVTWFGQHGPYRDYAGGDAVCAALSGLAFGIGEADGPPILPSGYGPQVIAGVTAAVSVMTALLGQGENERGEQIDLSIQEALLILTETGAIARSYEMDSIPQRYGINLFPPTFPMGVYRCADGWVGVTALTPAQWRAFCSLLEIPGAGDDPRFFTSLDRFIAADELDELICPRTLNWSARELVEQGQAVRIPLALVPTPDEILVQPEFVERGGLSTHTLSNHRQFQAPGIPFRLEQTPGNGSGNAPGLDQHRQEILQFCSPQAVTKENPAVKDGPVRPMSAPKTMPLAGLRIIDLSKGWSGPLAARLCADLGAEVIKVEDCRYPDWWRGWESTPEWVAQRDYEKSPAFNSMNRNKYGITLDLTSKEGTDILKRLVADADAVIENYTSTVLRELALDYAHLSKVNPDIVMISMTAYGMSSPWSHHRAYGSTVEQAAGLPHLNGQTEWPPTHQHVALGDAVSGINAAVALLIGLYHKQQTGMGQFIDLSQVECLLPLGAHGIIEYSANEKYWPRLGSRHPEFAPHGVYSCHGEESWLAITCFSNRQWQALVHVLGMDEMAQDARFKDQASRKQNEDALDAMIAAWSHDKTAAQAMHLLQAAKVPAGVVTSAQNLVDNPHLLSRGYFAWAPGVHRDLVMYPLPPYILSGVRQGVRWPAPMLGEHNSIVLQDKLGLTDVEIQHLEDQQIIGTVPII